ncbi:MAG: SMC family ATPase, partial [FCB group bacterium]|nr:SMC family ATPase [FCB group bacterium]
MILRSLFLQNFRGYETLDLSFQDGITGIVGRNGAGKSTLLEAILWCLFGVRAARTSKEGIKRQSCAVTDPCQVRLEFELNGTTYELTRSLIGKSLRSEARLAQQGSLDAVSTREVDDYIVRLIGLDMKGFLSSFFARQKELNALFDARPADRKDHLAQMLGVGRLDNAIQALKEDLKEIRQKIDFLTDLKIDPDK